MKYILTMERYLSPAIAEDALASGKIAFISGPRQVGKTTLAKTLASAANYFTFDDESFRKLWVSNPASAIATRQRGPVVLDEIHKDRRWKSKLKGLYDTLDAQRFIVTGSARLDVYRRGSDSLLGRYFPYRLHPYSVAETSTPPAPDSVGQPGPVAHPWADLLRLGGFPEPLLGGSEKRALRWSRLRLDRLAYEDVRDLRAVSDTQAFRVTAELLGERASGLLSVNALREDVGVAYATVRAWVDALDTLFYVFRVPPFSGRIARALRAENKVYLYDILRIPAERTAARLENLAALHLKKACDFWTDTAEGDFSLRFVRDKEKREVDFLVLRDGKPWLLAECKSAETEPSPALRHYRALLSPKHCFQLVDVRGFDREWPAYGVRVIDYERFFSSLV